VLPPLTRCVSEASQTPLLARQACKSIWTTSRSNRRQMRSARTIRFVGARAGLIALAVPPLQEWVAHKPTCAVIPSPRAFIRRSRFATSLAGRPAANIATRLMSIGRRVRQGRDFPRIASPLVGVLGTIGRPGSARTRLGPQVRGPTAPPFMQGCAQRTAAALRTGGIRVRRLPDGLCSARQHGGKNDDCYSFSHRAPHSEAGLRAIRKGVRPLCRNGP
jgi:hypothetical protein